MKVVVALGGNALGNTPTEQFELLKEASNSIVDLVEQGHNVIVVHGNGPQVGMIQNAFDQLGKVNEEISFMPLAECVAMSQGYIGSQLQLAIKNTLISRKINRNVSTLITHVVVDKDDKAFENPTKPIGSFHSKEEAEKMQREHNIRMVEDSGRGFRVVVPSPNPVDIVEKNIIQNLYNEKNIIITSGGGGIPVVVEDGQYISIPAVIDKDMAGAKLATLVDADLFLILTAVNRVYTNFGKPSQKEVKKMSSNEAKLYIKEGQFAPGSMLPKIKAAIEFVDQKIDSQVIIGSLEEASLAIKGNAGTIIYKE